MWLVVGKHTTLVPGARTLDYPTVKLNRAKLHRMITMPTDRQTDRRTDKHHGNNATIRSNERIARL